MTMPKNPTMAEHFGWKLHPFSDTYQLPQPFSSQRDQRITDQALSLLSYGKSFAITGPSGSGKSTLIQHLIANLDSNYYLPILIHYGGLQRNAVLKTVADMLGVETNGRAVPLLVKLQKHMAEISTGTNPLHPVIVIDDAQLLERQSFMDLCSLIVCPPKKNAAASLIFLGDETLAKQLNLTVMTPIQSRLTTNFHTEPLNEEETYQFISLRLKHAKAPKDLFEPDALPLVAAHCRGNRRQIMNTATMLIHEAFDRKEQTICSQLLINSDVLS